MRRCGAPERVLTASPALAAPIESIEAIEPGATVASVDPATGEATTAIVSATPARLFEGTIYDITVDPGEPGGGDETTISATGEHPFLVARAGPHAAALDTRADPEAVALVEPLDTRDRTGQDLTGQDLAGQDRAGHGRWVPASDLAEGDAVRTMSPQGVAGTATVTKIRGRHAVVPVYNLTVEGTSRYLVGACGVVVHNKGEGAGGGGSAATVRYGPVNAGPLPAEVANTFRGGSYTGTVLSETTTLYRVHGGAAGELGLYWTRTLPAGPLQSRIDLAILPAWGNSATRVTTIRVPSGTLIFEGCAAGQGGLVGGGSQVVIPNVNPAWIIR